MATMRRRLYALPAAMLVAVALVAASCGGGGASSSSSGTPDTASLAPADAGLWATVDTDRGSAQWKALDAVLAKIPGAQSVIDSALAQISKAGSKTGDFQSDILPVLGKEVVVVLPSGASTPVVLAKPTDESKFEGLFTGATQPAKTTHDGWTVVAKSQKAIDAYTAAASKGSLADSDAFKQAFAGLPADALARVYVNGKGLEGVSGSAAGAASGALKSLPIPGLGNLPNTATGGVDTKALERLGTIGVVLSAGANEVRVDGSFSGSSAQAGSYTPKLLRQVPADALAAVSLSGSSATTGQVRDALAGAGADATVKQLEKSLGVSLEDLLGLVSGEGVLYVRPGLIIPEVTLMLAPKDPATALGTLDALASKLAKATGGKLTSTTVAGAPFKVVNVSILGIGFGRAGDKLVVSTVPSGYVDFDAQRAKLVDSDRFKQAAADVGYGGTTSGFAYVDVKALTPLLNTIGNAAASSAGSSSPKTLKRVVDALSAIDWVVLNSKVDGKRALFQGAVRVG